MTTNKGDVRSTKIWAGRGGGESILRRLSGDRVTLRPTHKELKKKNKLKTKNIFRSYGHLFQVTSYVILISSVIHSSVFTGCSKCLIYLWNEHKQIFISFSKYSSNPDRTQKLLRIAVDALRDLISKLGTCMQGYQTCSFWITCLRVFPYYQPDLTPFYNRWNTLFL